MDEMKKQPEISPLIIENYFDGELKSDEIDAIREDLVRTPTYEALLELRQTVRVDSECALHDIDGCALLDAINRQIDEECKPARNPLSQSKRRTSKQFFQRWAPALIGAALFLLSIPGLAHWIAAGNRDTGAQTVVIVDGGKTQSPTQPAVVSYPRETVQTIPAGNQLTVDEMDAALRLLIKRIERLEDANRTRIESGNQPIDASPTFGENHL